MPPSPLQRAAAWPPMMALLLGAIIEAPIKAYSQPARSSEVKCEVEVVGYSTCVVIGPAFAVPVQLSSTEFYSILHPGHSLRMRHDQRVR